MLFSRTTQVWVSNYNSYEQSKGNRTWHEHPKAFQLRVQCNGKTLLMTKKVLPGKHQHEKSHMWKVHYGPDGATIV